MLTVNNVWTANDFNQHMAKVKTENPDRKDLFQYAEYGAFHAWKGENTNFHEVATTILKAEALAAREQNLMYTELVFDVGRAWMSFATMNDLEPTLAYRITKRYVTNELGKINNWVSKQLNFNEVNQ